MSAAEDSVWKNELGIEEGHDAAFFESKDDLLSRDVNVPHAHVVRRAFDLLEVDGVLCDQTSPIVYFKVVSEIDSQKIANLHRRFWNHGGAPILAVISPTEVHIYSGLTRPTGESRSESVVGLVDKINRSSKTLREFLPAVESGEFFRRHSTSFKPTERVDQALLNNLKAAREKLASAAKKDVSEGVLDAFLCRLVFACYLFDREVIGPRYLDRLGLRNLAHLRDILGIKPRSEAKAYLYRLFQSLAEDFNGDLFNDDLDAESELISAAQISTVDEFFRGTDILTGQAAFWPYDFEAIPIETISAIYERFLKPSDKKSGSFYTPRFLAELVLDLALSQRNSLLGLRFLDPACGSGIFLVGLFNRIAEEWKRSNPTARNDRRAKELAELLRTNIFGIDINPTACRITAFSLYLAYLDQLSPRDIQELQAKGRLLPKLVSDLSDTATLSPPNGICCGDFFQEDAPYPSSIDVVVGNPPWGSIVGKGSLASTWLEKRKLTVPDGQIAAAFMWKAATHVSQNGRICLVLPHGVLFNHSTTAIPFQKAFIQSHSLDRVLNLTDFQFVLFSEAKHPALVLSYRRCAPRQDHKIDYWSPKADWKALRTEIITVSEQDRNVVPLRKILSDLAGADGPQTWKQLSWASPRDRRFLDRLSDFTRLRDCVRQVRESDSTKPWLIAEGFQPPGPSDNRDDSVILQLPSDRFIAATSPWLQLVLLEEDCDRLGKAQVTVRSRSNKNTEVYKSPHVIVAQGFGSIAFADFPVSFRHALRGITGPVRDRDRLVFLAGYLRSPLARYYQFHTSSNWGVGRQKVHVEELLRLPFPSIEETARPDRARDIIKEVVATVERVANQVRKILGDRNSLIEETQTQLNQLIYEYFDVTDSERVLIDDAAEIVFDSFRPSADSREVPALKPSTPETRASYTNLLCRTLNGWASRTSARVIATTSASSQMGLGLVSLTKVGNGVEKFTSKTPIDLLSSLHQLRHALSIKANTFELARGIKLFDGPQLYIVKPLDRRYWSKSAALNDADDIASSVLMHSSEKFA